MDHRCNHCQCNGIFGSFAMERLGSATPDMDLDHDGCCDSNHVLGRLPVSRCGLWLGVDMDLGGDRLETFRSICHGVSLCGIWVCGVRTSDDRDDHCVGVDPSKTRAQAVLKNKKWGRKNGDGDFF